MLEILTNLSGVAPAKNQSQGKTTLARALTIEEDEEEKSEEEQEDSNPLSNGLLFHEL